jgi:hypothetical protein
MMSTPRFTIGFMLLKGFPPPDHESFAVQMMGTPLPTSSLKPNSLIEKEFGFYYPPFGVQLAYFVKCRWVH